MADERRRMSGADLNVYRCDFCPAWHMGDHWRSTMSGDAAAALGENGVPDTDDATSAASTGTRPTTRC